MMMGQSRSRQTQTREMYMTLPIYSSSSIRSQSAANMDISVHNHDGRARDHRAPWREGSRYPCGRAAYREHRGARLHNPLCTPPLSPTATSQPTLTHTPEARSHRHRNLQLWRNLVGPHLYHALEAVPAAAAHQPRGPLQAHTNAPARIRVAGMARTRYCRIPADIFPLLPRQDGVCDRKGGHERADKGAGDGVGGAGEEGDGHHEYLASGCDQEWGD